MEHSPTAEGVPAGARPIDAWRAVVVAHDTLMNEFAVTLKEFGLSVAQYDVLLRLIQQREGSVAMGELARTLLYSSGAATKLVDRLVALGHVARSRATHDGRVVMVSLTVQGRALAKAAARRHAADVDARVAPFDSPDEARHVMAYLARMALPAQE